VAETTTIVFTYADYLQEHHDRFLNETEAKRLIAILDSPYDEYTYVEVDKAFFGTGYSHTDFPSLYDMYGKFMAGFDIDAAWRRAFNETVNASEIEDIIFKEVDLLDDTYDKVVIPKYKLSMREMNAVQSSTFVVGSALIENKRQLEMLKILSNTVDDVIPLVNAAHADFLNHQKETVRKHALNVKQYYMTEMYVADRNYTMSARGASWPMTVLEYERKNLGALTRSRIIERKDDKPRKRSKLSKHFLITQYTYQGMQIGGMITPGWGHLVGAIVGQHIGIAITLLEDGQPWYIAATSYEHIPGFYPFAWFA
jgi:hypothetical protein